MEMEMSGVFMSICSKSEQRSIRRKKSSADLGFHYPGDLLSQAKPRRRPLYKRNTVSDFANSKCRHTSTATIMSSIEHTGKSLNTYAKPAKNGILGWMLGTIRI